MSKVYTTKFILLFAALLTPGCILSFSRGEDQYLTTIENAGTTTFSDKKVYVDMTFETKWPLEGSYLETTKSDMLNVIRNTKIFSGVSLKRDNVVPSEENDLIMELQFKYYQDVPWWGTAQFVTLALHTLILPTLPHDNQVVIYYSIFDRKYNVIGKWKFKYERRWTSNLFAPTRDFHVDADPQYTVDCLYDGLKRIEKLTDQKANNDHATKTQKQYLHNEINPEKKFHKDGENITPKILPQKMHSLPAAFLKGSQWAGDNFVYDFVNNETMMLTWLRNTDKKFNVYFEYNETDGTLVHTSNLGSTIKLKFVSYNNDQGVILWQNTSGQTIKWFKQVTNVQELRSRPPITESYQLPSSRFNNPAEGLNDPDALELSK